jgi:hypothetical protein
MNRSLDSIVDYSHSFTFRGKKVHPYFLFADVSLIISIVFSYFLWSMVSNLTHTSLHPGSDDCKSSRN